MRLHAVVAAAVMAAEVLATWAAALVVATSAAALVVAILAAASVASPWAAVSEALQVSTLPGRATTSIMRGVSALVTGPAITISTTTGAATATPITIPITTIAIRPSTNLRHRRDQQAPCIVFGGLFFRDAMIGELKELNLYLDRRLSSRGTATLTRV